MAIELIAKIKPKNGGDFALVDAQDVDAIVPTNQVQDVTGHEGNLLRYSYHVGAGIRLGDYDGYRIHRVGVRAAAGAAVRFVLYSLSWTDEENGVMTQIAVLGDAVADEETQVAALTFTEPYEVRQDNTILLAFAREAVIQCQTLGGGLSITGLEQFADGDYFENENGAEIPFFNGKTTEDGTPWYSIHIREIDLFREVTLEAYIRETALQLAQIGKDIGDVLPTVTVLDNGKVLSVVDGAAAWAEPSGGVSSWNDLTDKPFYEEGVTETVLEEATYEGFEQNINFNNLYTRDFEVSPLLLGQTYRVVWNGKEYICEAKDASAVVDGAVGLGNLSIFDGTGNNEPFVIGWTANFGSILISLEEKTENTVAIYHDNTVVKTLDEKYLPMDAIDARIEAYISEALEGDY